MKAASLGLARACTVWDAMSCLVGASIFQAMILSNCSVPIVTTSLYLPAADFRV